MELGQARNTRSALLCAPFCLGVIRNRQGFGRFGFRRPFKIPPLQNLMALSENAGARDQTTRQMTFSTSPMAYVSSVLMMAAHSFSRGGSGKGSVPEQMRYNGPA
jgi:hypothetical protein